MKLAALLNMGVTQRPPAERTEDALEPSYAELLKALDDLVTHGRLAFPGTPYHKAKQHAQTLVNRSRA